MDARQYNAILNMFMYGYGTAMGRMLDMKLITRQLGNAMIDTELGPKFLESIGFTMPNGGGVKEIAEDYAQQFKDIGITNLFDILEATEDTLKVDVGMCIFSSATQAFLQDGVEIPACPVVIILESILDKKLNKHSRIVKYERKEETNSSVFTIDLIDR